MVIPNCNRFVKCRQIHYNLIPPAICITFELTDSGQDKRLNKIYVQSDDSLIKKRESFLFSKIISHF